MLPLDAFVFFRLRLKSRLTPSSPDLGRLYRIVRCSNCGNLQITSARKKFRCVRCGAVQDISSVKPLYVTEDSRKARKVLAELKSRGKALGFKKPAGMKWG